jgi:replicative DNA helicase
MKAPIYVDDTGSITMMEIRSKARRLKTREPRLGLIIVDYLQLMTSGTTAENRVQEVSQISRNLKVLARDLDVPILAMSQLSRAVEQRHDKRPILSDLRESGCLTGDSRVYLPDEGVYRPIRELVGRSGFRVLAVNAETWRLEPRAVTNAFSTGRKPVYRLRTRLGRTIRATGNHKFLSFSGWRRLDDLGPGARVALPRRTEGHGQATMSESEVALLGHLIGDGCTLPSHAIQYTSKDRDLAELVASLATDVFGNAVRPRIKAERTWFQVYLPSSKHLTHRVRNPIAQWLDDLGVFGLRSWEKHVPAKVFAQPPELIATFLRHLWSTDGCLRADPKAGVAVIRYDSSSEDLTRNVQSLLLRLGINARIREVDMGTKGRPIYRLDVWAREDAERFLTVVSAVGVRKRRQQWDLIELLERRPRNPNRDVIPSEAWRNLVVPAMQRSGVTTRAMQRRIGTRYCGSSLYVNGLSRERALRVADAVDSDELGLLAMSDVYWDEIVSIDPDGVEDVYDLTVDGLHNFIADDILAHNSIEQDSDLVMFVYRDEYYNEDTDQQGLAEIILSKHRNGPTGIERLSFLKRYAKFADLAS